MSDQIEQPHATDQVEALAVRAYVQGFLFQAARLELINNLRQPVRVDQAYDADGEIVRYFTLTLASGMRLHVHVDIAQ